MAIREIRVTVDFRDYSVRFDGEKALEIVGLYRRGPTRFWRAIWTLHHERMGKTSYLVFCAARAILQESDDDAGAWK